MRVIRKDGNRIMLSEEKIVLELICRTYRPAPYTHEELMAINNLDGTLTLSVEVNHADEDMSTKYILTFFDKKDECFYRESYEYYVDYTTDRTRWNAIRELCYHRLGEIEVELNSILGTDCDVLDVAVWHSDLSEYVQRWKRTSHALDDKDCLYAKDAFRDVDKEHHPQLEMLWMIAVEKFGDFSGSPKFGWIDDLDKFELWCDEITHTYRIRKSTIEFTK